MATTSYDIVAEKIEAGKRRQAEREGLTYEQFLDKESNARARIATKHGDQMDCPSCGIPGFLDVDTPAGHEVKGGAVWFNPHSGWECTDCCDT